MKRDKTKPANKPVSYLSLLEQEEPLRNVQIDYPLPYGRELSPEQMEEQKRQYRRFLLLQIIRA